MSLSWILEDVGSWGAKVQGVHVFLILIYCVYIRVYIYIYMHYIVWGTDSWHLSPQSWLKGTFSGKPHDLDNTVITGPQHMDSLQF